MARRGHTRPAQTQTAAPKRDRLTPEAIGLIGDRRGRRGINFSAVRKALVRQWGCAWPRRRRTSASLRPVARLAAQARRRTDDGH
jgi:hypothetical protein